MDKTISKRNVSRKKSKNFVVAIEAFCYTETRQKHKRRRKFHMIQFGMRAHDFSAPKPAKEFLNGLSNAGIRYVQLAFEKSFSDLDFATGRYSAGYAQYLARILRENEVHCAVL